MAIRVDQHSTYDIVSPLFDEHERGTVCRSGVCLLQIVSSCGMVSHGMRQHCPSSRASMAVISNRIAEALKAHTGWDAHRWAVGADERHARCSAAATWLERYGLSVVTGPQREPTNTVPGDVV